MRHTCSTHDRLFSEDFEAGRVTPDAFDHRAHLRLAYILLCDHEPDAACEAMKTALSGFLAHHGINPEKYHETLTRAWILAVRHFMERTETARDADHFIEQNPVMLDSKIMLSHYSAELLFSERARQDFVEPDREEIPRYEDHE